MEGPLEFAEGNGQTRQRDITLGAGIAQPLGFGGQVRSHLGQQIWLVEFECFAQFELKRSILDTGNAELKNHRGFAVEVTARRGREQGQTGQCGGLFEGSDERAFRLNSHAWGILR